MWLWLVLLSPLWAYPIAWPLYVFAMYLDKTRKRRKKEGRPLHWIVWLFALPWVIAGYGLDLYCNLTTMSIVGLEFPIYGRGEGLTTGRFQRWVNPMEPYEWEDLHNRSFLRYWRARWQRLVATWLCRETLEPFDAGHCKRPGENA